MCECYTITYGCGHTISYTLKPCRVAKRNGKPCQDVARNRNVARNGNAATLENTNDTDLESTNDPNLKNTDEPNLENTSDPNVENTNGPNIDNTNGPSLGNALVPKGRLSMPHRPCRPCALAKYGAKNQKSTKRRTSGA